MDLPNVCHWCVRACKPRVQSTNHHPKVSAFQFWLAFWFLAIFSPKCSPWPRYCPLSLRWPGLLSWIVQRWGTRDHLTPRQSWVWCGVPEGPESPKLGSHGTGLNFSQRAAEFGHCCAGQGCVGGGTHHRHTPCAGRGDFGFGGWVSSAQNWVC